MFGKEDVLSVSGDYGIVNQIEFQGRSFAGASVAPYGIVDTGDIVYTKSPLKSNPYGIIKANKGKTGIVSTLYAVYKPLDNVCSDFVQIYFEQDARMNNYMRPLVNKGAKNDMKVSDVNVLKGEVCFPSKYEQIKISEHFAKLDRLIALHQRKCDQTKELKKFMLQKMFPKKGEKNPEIRFPGFTDDWEQRKLSDIADRFDNLRVPITASERKSGDTPYYGANGIQDYVEGFTHDGEFILVAEDGANDLKNYPVQYVNGKVWVNNHAHVLQGKNTITDNKFLMNSIKNFNIEPFLVGGGRAKLNADVMMKLNILLPTFDEQEKIGSFFKQLDDTIALHQRKCEQLKELKKFMLQNMFPKKG